MKTRFQSDAVIDSVTEPLLAPKVAFGGLDRHMAEEELDLFKFTSRLMAKPGAGSTEVMRSD